MSRRFNLAIVGLGYVGLPLAVAFARRHKVVGFDIDRTRIAELRSGHDRTGEIEPAALEGCGVCFAHDPEVLRGADIFIVTVPTPVDAENRPDLSAVIAASGTVGRALGRGAVVVFESTVWPGVTEEVCAPILAKESGLEAGRDFDLGYSPERINPGDREHRVETITKVVAAQRPEIASLLAELYGGITNGGVFVARDIRTAEAAKVIENAQRDINIAFINEVAQIFHKMGISTHDVLEAARTKWNFLDFKPGLVGGHCIGVDPYYLAHRAVEIGHDPKIILAGRRLNDSMGTYVADSIADALGAANGRPVLVLGLTFKENVPDLRNTRVIDVIGRLAERGFEVAVHDPLADRDEAARYYGVSLLDGLDGIGGYACVLGAVGHAPYAAFTTETFARLAAPGGLIADLRGIWRNVALPEGMRRWEL